MDGQSSGRKYKTRGVDEALKKRQAQMLREQMSQILAKQSGKTSKLAAKNTVALQSESIEMDCWEEE